MDFSLLNNLVVKFGSIAVMLVYVFFAMVLTRQVRLMVNTFNTSYKKLLVGISWGHLGMSILILILAFLF